MSRGVYWGGCWRFCEVLFFLCVTKTDCGGKVQVKVKISTLEESMPGRVVETPFVLYCNRQ